MTVQELYEFEEKFVKVGSGSGEVLAPKTKNNIEIEPKGKEITI